MAKKSHHFDWKKLEEKPDNWETLRHLIGLCNSASDIYEDHIETSSRAWTMQYLDIFKTHIVSRYGRQTEALFPKLSVPVEKTDKKKKNNKKTANPLREQIQMETDKKMITKDIDMIRIDEKKGRPLMMNFKMQPTFYFLIVEWIICIMKNRSIMNNGVVIDAMISMDRIYREEIMDNTMIPDIIKTFFADINRIAQGMLEMDDVFAQLFYHRPELMIYPFSQKREGRMGLYGEQIRLLNAVVDAVVLDRPLLLGDRMPPGTGKTFLVVPLTQKLVALKTNKTILFACQNQLVRTDVATTALLGKNLHMWMGRYDAVNDEFLIRPYKSCFPNTWKKVYKTHDDHKSGNVNQQMLFYKNATGKFPDLIVADLETCLALLKESSMQHQFIAYIDEFVSDQKANTVMTHLAEYLPRQTILLSAILPRFEDMPSFIQHFRMRHGASDDAIVRIEANQLTISCTLVDQEGLVALPHHFIDSVDQIPILIRRIREDPLIGRMYAPQQVYQMIDHIRTDLQGTGYCFEDHFPTASTIDHAGVRDYVLCLLEFMIDRPDVFEKMKAFRPRIMSRPEIQKIATRDSHYFIGRTLVITSKESLFPILEEIRTDLMDGAPDIRSIMSSMEKERKEIERQMEHLRDSKRSDSRVDPVELQLDMSRLSEQLSMLQRFPWPEKYIVNTVQHAQRFHHDILRPAPIPTLTAEYQELPDLLFELLLSGIGVYDFSQCTDHHRRLAMKAIRHISILFGGDEIVFGTNIEGLTNLFIDGTFGDRVSRNVLFQLIGRAGRIGQSYQALVVLNSQTTLDKIMSFHDLQDMDALFFEQHFAQLI